MVGLSGGAISQVFLGRVVDEMKALGCEGRARWDPAFPIYGGVPLAGGVLWLFVEPPAPGCPRRARVTRDASSPGVFDPAGPNPPQHARHQPQGASRRLPIKYV